MPRFVWENRWTRIRLTRPEGIVRVVRYIYKPEKNAPRDSILAAARPQRTAPLLGCADLNAGFYCSTSIALHTFHFAQVFETIVTLV
jgi:hypothetical protein